jgi:translation initiation factor IF-3
VLAGRRDYIRRPRSFEPPTRKGPRVNKDIEALNIRLVDAEGEMQGVVTREIGIEAAEAAGLDLVEISPNADPPVCKVLDYGKYKYEAQKKAHDARKKQKTVDVKEIKMRPGIDVHDYDVKLRNARRFLDDGDKVKVTIRFRGREMAHQDLGMKVLERVRDELDELAKVEQFPQMEGRLMTMVIAPR